MFDTLADPLVAAGIGEPTGMADLDPARLVAVVESAHWLESMLIARRLAAVAALLRHRVAAAAETQARRGYATVDGFEQTARLPVSSVTATTR